MTKGIQKKNNKKNRQQRAYFFVLIAPYGGGVGGEAESRPLINSFSPHHSWHINLIDIN